MVVVFGEYRVFAWPDFTGAFERETLLERFGESSRYDANGAIGVAPRACGE